MGNNTIVDSHIHVGQFNGLYISPAYISKLMSDVGVDYYAVSSTSMCEENYLKVLAELRDLIALDGNKVLPIMWVTPEGLNGNIAWFLESEIKWRCIKVHPELHPNDWDPQGEQLSEIIDIASELDLPILIHTGNKESCQSGKYEKLIEQHPSNTFILAHGRPIEESLRIISLFPNAYVDTAFMPIDDIRILIYHGLDSKILWGTDMCIPQYYFPKQDMIQYYKNKLMELREICTKEQFELLTSKNAIRVFDIQ